MDKRTFLKKSALLTIGGSVAASAPLGAFQSCAGAGTGEEITLPELPYAYDALEPHIDAMTMEIHHSRHHAGYTSKFSAALKELELEGTAVQELFGKVSSLPVSIRNNGGGYYNHKLFWNSMSPNGGGEPGGELTGAIEQSFGGFEKFREVFSSAAATRFGSGWAWLVRAGDGKLEVTSTPNQDNPLMDVVKTRGVPIIGLDVWEHAYYLKYQNRRTDYIAAFWEVVNWDFAGERYSQSVK